tara:strand:+ start:234 stop:659 length:426 start_codon:yes stop_codon:yes gene_type:complete
MNKEQLKKTLRPLIKECIKEVIFEEGILSGIISEVMKGVGSQRIVETPRQPSYKKPQIDHEEKQRRLKEHRRKVLDSIGSTAYNGVDLFEGTKPLTQQAAGKSSGGHGSKALEGMAPNDPGVDISAFTASSAIWSKLAKGK